MVVLLNPYRHAAGIVWNNAFITNFDTTQETAWGGYTMRQVLTGASLLATGTRCRVNFKAPTTGSEVLGLYHAYIGLKAAAGDVYDFSAAPTELLFGGVSGFSGLAIGGNIWSDETVFAVTGVDLVISFRMSSITLPRGNLGASNAAVASSWYKNASDAITVNATGYTSDTTVNCFGGLQVRTP